MAKFWRNKIIDLYIVKEVFLPFLTGMTIVVIFFVSNILFQITDYMIVKKVPVPLVLEYFGYRLPAIIVEAFPIAVLFATMWGMARFSRENEFTALRMGGISLYRLVLPLVILGVLISGVTFFINDRIVPYSNHRSQNILRRSILKETTPDIDDDVFFKGPKGRLFYVKEYNEEKNILKKVVIYNEVKEDEYPEVITANTGKAEDNMWYLQDGIIHKFNNNGELYRGVMFDKMDFEIASKVENFFGEQYTSSEQSRAELKEDIELFRRSGLPVHRQLVDYHLKLAMPLSALIFILVGTPLSLNTRDSRAFSIIMTILIVFSYYLILSLSQSFGKNKMLPPLLAAWLPNIMFSSVGILLLVWRETWNNWLSRILSGILIAALIVGVPFTASAENADITEENNTNSTEKIIIENMDQLHYHKDKGKFVVSGNLKGQYQEFYLFADKAVIKREDGTEETFGKAEQIMMDQGKFSGCNLDTPHYYFDAEEVVIYPEDHMAAKNVVFRELNGELPLFYWPYLYISLKDKDQKIIPEVGYNNQRGWFIKTTYNYWYQNRLPGEFYLDYYTISGFAGGFKQHLYYEKDLKAYLKLFGQQNKTSLSGLYNWTGELDIDDDRGDLTTDANIKYTEYDQYSYLDSRLILNKSTDDRTLKINASFDSKDYYSSNNNDDKEISYDLTYSLPVINEWELYLNYNRDFEYTPEDGLKKRWGGTGKLSKQFDDTLLNVLVERKAPRVSEEENEEGEVTYYKWPEVELEHNPEGNFDYTVLAGKYLEQNGDEGYRGKGIINYKKSFDLSEAITASTTQTVTGSIYKMINSSQQNLNQYISEESQIPYQLTHNSKVKVNTELTPDLTLTNNYNYLTYRGETPFAMDKVNLQEKIDSKLRYSVDNFNFDLKNSYDVYNEKLLPVSGSTRWQVTPDWKLSAGTSYDFEKEKFGDLAINSKYKNEPWELNSALKFNLNDDELHRVDNQLVYKIEDDLHFNLNSRYDNQDQEFDEANIMLKKYFHCRSLTFGYDHLEEEFTVQYNINLFPEQGIKIGRNKEDAFMFDLGIRENLGLEDDF